MSDLLRRASDESSRPQPNGAATPSPAGNGAGPPDAAGGNTAQALGSLTADIAKAIDDKASLEAWERVRRGERNVFTRRLYTLHGQQTFDQIRKRYQKNADFKEAVDRYVADFEKLLGEVAGTDKKAGNAYLTSDTGKVYTMLAHASGRFD